MSNVNARLTRDRADSSSDSAAAADLGLLAGTGNDVITETPPAEVDSANGSSSVDGSPTPNIAN